MFNKFMEMAIAEAKIAFDKGEIPVGAVVVKNGEIIAKGHNLRETNCDVSAHAEIVALRGAGKKLGRWQLYDCDLYVTLQPCKMCKEAIAQARVNALYFGAYDKKNEFFMTDTTVYGGIMENDCTRLLNEFFEKIR